MLRLYNFFHLNIMFSSIEEEQRQDVIKNCYWPLLRMCRQQNIPVGVEASGYTLEVIAILDPEWIIEFKSLIKLGLCELIGCGYTQIIGPLAPAEVNQKNLQLGAQVYEDLIGLKPTVALVNEQAYSSGLISIYKESGYQALIMEWENSFKSNSQWLDEWKYHPQIGIGPHEEEISIIWNQSIAFQKFQRYVHGDLELADMLSYIGSHCSDKDRFFSFYGSDAEVFGYRPGRFDTEGPVQADEWLQIERLIRAISSSIKVDWILPSDVLKSKHLENSHRRLTLGSAAKPTPVKKQLKYNISRWSVSGRNDFNVNTRCFALAKRLSDLQSSSADWKELCYLWSSDFRTHITEKRWTRFDARLRAFEARIGKRHSPSLSESLAIESSHVPPKIKIQGKIITVETEQILVTFNCQKGLSIEKYIDKQISSRPLFGTISHGFFSDIGYSADFYSGILTYQSPGQHQVTDLAHTVFRVFFKGSAVYLVGIIKTRLGRIRKIWKISGGKRMLTLRIGVNWKDASIGSLRLFPVTLIPDTFDQSSLFIETHNGGFLKEQFLLGTNVVKHGKPVSFLVSSQEGLGVTAGEIAIGDLDKRIMVSFCPSQSAFLGQITHEPVDSTWFTRVALTAREVDDTAKPAPISLKATINISSDW